MKKKLLIIGGAILAVLLLCTLLVPHLILFGVRQEKVAEDCNYGDVFFNEYDEVRAHFLDKVAELNASGITTESVSFAIDEADGLYIDTVHVPAKEKKNLIVLTTGVHGIEGYIGSVC